MTRKELTDILTGYHRKQYIAWFRELWAGKTWPTNLPIQITRKDEVEVVCLLSRWLSPRERGDTFDHTPPMKGL